jgi:Cu-Zn family superoxide dismutase
MRKILALAFVCLTILVRGAEVKSVTVNIKNAEGKTVGQAVLSPAQPHGVKLDLTITNLPPGKHVFHIHQLPDCDASEEFNSAGLQYDPTGEMYGNEHHAAHSGPSAGDPGMAVDVDSTGKGRLSTVFHRLSMGADDRSLFNKKGTAIIFHAAPGAQGPTRIACGVILPPK